MSARSILMHRWCLFFMVAMMAACGTHSADPIPVDLEGVWKKEGLNLGNFVAFTIHQNLDTLYIGTDQGIFKRSVGGSSEDWEYIGLQSGDSPHSFNSESYVEDLVVWNAREMMAAVRYPVHDSENVVLYRTDDGGADWQSVPFGGVGIDSKVSQIELDPENPGRIYALGGLAVARSEDRGAQWEAVYRTWASYTNNFKSGNFLTVHNESPSTVWGGGREINNNPDTPSLFKSEDGGENWFDLTSNIPGDSLFSATDAVMQTDDPETVLASFLKNDTNGPGPLSGDIYKTIDGGQSWTESLEHSAIFALARGAQYPDRVYAAGQFQNDIGSLFFAASDDFGETWTMKIDEDVSFSTGTRDLLVTVAEGREKIFFATTNGIYSYTLTTP